MLFMGSGCTPGDLASHAKEPGARSQEPSVLQPGRPGEDAATLGSDVEVPESEWNHSDVMFMQMMVPHHAQALEMAALAPARAEGERVKALARRISGAQGPEIMSMSAWLAARDIEVPEASDDWRGFDHSRHGHAGMAGMLSGAEMKRLSAARGAEFDRLFLRGMIGHHNGAVEMAQRVATDGVDLQVQELAADVATGQAAEVARMKDMLRRL